MVSDWGADIIVVNHYTPDDLQGFLDSLQHVMMPYHLWIVNVGADEPSRNVALRYLDSKSNVSVLQHASNIGYGPAVNHAALGGHRDIIGIFNADVRITPDSFERCYDALRGNDWGVLGPRQVDERHRITHAGIFGTNSEPTMRGWLQHDSLQYTDTRPAISVMGSAYFIKREVWNHLAACPIYRKSAPAAKGAFLPTPLYYEETWCSYHARAHGFEVMYYGQVEMVHKWHQSVLATGESAAMEKMKIARQMFREACDAHGIEHD